MQATIIFPVPAPARKAKADPVYVEFRRMALQLINAGIRHYGAKSIIETIRFHTTVAHPDEQFKVNNNRTALYARRFMAEHPEHAGFFAVRRSKYDEII